MIDLWQKLFAAAKVVQAPRSLSPFMEAGGVSAAIYTAQGNIYTGVCIDTSCSLGMCAERNALSTMITNGEQDVTHVLAILPNGKVGAPCGACREFMMQLGPKSKDILVLMDYDTLHAVPLGELCPDWWTLNRFTE